MAGFRGVVDVVDVVEFEVGDIFKLGFSVLFQCTGLEDSFNTLLAMVLFGECLGSIDLCR